ncbi:MAG: DNA-formamidopyrimidine glycosylase [Oscillatoria sp. PMC 1068.18]|nr:DNA-formamidopyrimidine glycosylase [Oscillatoria sp. PMC 1076.18]MEC4989056.1 DNA-formamidopyrimidine glycosylase [Oscillatoria sp. PMC 1068.18]
MPELPEVETVCRGLNKLTLNQEIKGGEVLLQRTLAYPTSVKEFWLGVEGKKISRWQRRGKYLLADLSSSQSKLSGWLGVHLRMSGQLLWVERESTLQKHTRVRWFVGESQELRFVDTRTFGKVWYVPPDLPPEKIITGLRKLGAEPFSSEFSPEYLAQKLQKSRRRIKTLLLDQAIAAGIGNIYADEALFVSGIHPQTLGCNLSQSQVERLHGAIIKVLQTGIDKGGTTFNSFLNLMGVNGNYMGVAWVYGRTGEPCRICGSAIAKMKITGRSSHFCPECQLGTGDW